VYLKSSIVRCDPPLINFRSRGYNTSTATMMKVTPFEQLIQEIS
jgi:hypothetical protein